MPLFVFVLRGWVEAESSWACGCQRLRGQVGTGRRTREAAGKPGAKASTPGPLLTNMGALPGGPRSRRPSLLLTPRSCLWSGFPTDPPRVPRPSPNPPTLPPPSPPGLAGPGAAQGGVAARGRGRALPDRPTHRSRGPRAAGAATPQFSLASVIWAPGPANPEAGNAAPARAAGAAGRESGGRRAGGAGAPPLAGQSLADSAGAALICRHRLLPPVLPAPSWVGPAPRVPESSQRPLERAPRGASGDRDPPASLSARRCSPPGPNGPDRGRAGWRHQRLGRQLLPEPGPLPPQGEWQQELPLSLPGFQQKAAQTPPPG